MDALLVDCFPYHLAVGLVVHANSRGHSGASIPELSVCHPTRVPLHGHACTLSSLQPKESSELSCFPKE